MEKESDLLRRVRALDEAALGEVYDATYPLLYRYIFHQVGHAMLAEDLTAEVFNRFLKQLHAGRGPHRYLKAWLYRVARNLVIDEARRQVHRNHANLREDMAADQQDVAERAQQSILSQQARASLLELTPKQRDVIILKYLEGMSNDEVASLLKLSVGAVKALQNRGLAAMRRKLERSGAVTKDST